VLVSIRMFPQFSQAGFVERHEVLGVEQECGGIFIKDELFHFFVWLVGFCLVAGVVDQDYLGAEGGLIMADDAFAAGDACRTKFFDDAVHPCPGQLPEPIGE